MLLNLAISWSMEPADFELGIRINVFPEPAYGLAIEYYFKVRVTTCTGSAHLVGPAQQHLPGAGELNLFNFGCDHFDI